MKKIIYSLVALLLATFEIVSAQDTSAVNQLDNVTVTAIRSAEKVLNVSGNVTVISANDIKQLPYRNLADLLQRYESVYVLGGMQTPGALQTLYLRGADNKQTLIMIDGIKLADASTPDNGLDFSELSTEDIDRIEILRGAQGTLYGSSAVGGVINIITQKNYAKGYKGNLRLEGGSFGKGTSFFQPQASVSYASQNGFFVKGEILHNTTNGFNAVQSPTDGSFFINEKDDFLKTDYTAKAGYSNNGWDIYASYRRASQKSDIDAGAFKDDESHKIKFRRNLFTYGVSKEINDTWGIKFFGGYTTTDRNDSKDSSLISIDPDVYDGVLSNGTYTGKALSNELQLNYMHSNWNIVAGGGLTNEMTNTHYDYANYAYGFTLTTNYDTVGLKMNTAFGYAHAVYSIPFHKNTVNLAGGLRYSSNSRFGNFVTYEFSPNIVINNKSSFYAVYSTGFNAPSLYQLFAPESDYTSNITRGNSTLKPEESRSIEAGFKSSYKNIIAFHVSVYKNEVKNYIDYVYLWNGSKPVDMLDYTDYRGDTYLNVGKQINSGVEAGIEIFISGQWELHSNISYNNGKLQYIASNINSSKTENNYVQLYSNGSFLTQDINDKTIRRPSVMNNSSVVFKPTKKWRIVGDMRIVGKRNDIYYDYTLGPFGALGRESMKGYTLFNISGNYIINSHLNIAACIFNIFNSSYTELIGYSTRPRTYSATVSFSF